MALEGISKANGNKIHFNIDFSVKYGKDKEKSNNTITNYQNKYLST